jgi:hypothetical protein
MSKYDSTLDFDFSVNLQNGTFVTFIEDANMAKTYSENAEFTPPPLYVL